MTELIQHQPQNALTDQMDYARAVAAGSLLPREYQGNPANVLIAMGLGQSMGLSPAESLYRITVIQGKPTASAELIAANVRKAGHRLRVSSTDTSCTATIIRHDDPDFEFTVTRDFAWAQSMGLASKDNYKKQPGTMLQWRAITAVARLACPEALYGVAYTPDEVDRDAEPATVKTPGVAGLRAAVIPDREQMDPATAVSLQRGLDQSAADETEDLGDFTQDIEDAVEVEEPKLSPRNRGRLFALFTQKGIPEDQQLAGIAHVVGRTPSHRDALNEDEFARVVAQLEAQPDAEVGSDA